MIVEFSVVDTKDFTIEHLFDSPENQDLIANFQATNDAAGLEDYLKIQSVEDEENNCSRTYLVKDALPEEKLIEHYHTMGFSRLPEHQEKFVQRHVKPKYDEGCIFMYQVI